MAHLHEVLDDDKHFRIDADTREIIRLGDKELTLIQGDHNSERCTFDVPKSIDGHDMTLCNVIRVHFININSENENEISASLYEVNELTPSEDDPSICELRWLISNEATEFVGTLSFLIEFMCKNDDDIIEYSWHTGIYTGGIINKGMNNANVVINKHYDVLNRWVALIEQAGERTIDNSITKIYNATANISDNIKTELNEYIAERAKEVQKDLAIYGLNVGQTLVHERGASANKAMSQFGVTQELSKMDIQISGNHDMAMGQIASLETRLDEAVIGPAIYEEVQLDIREGKTFAVLEIGKKYIVESEKGTNSWGFELNYGIVTESSSGPSMLNKSGSLRLEFDRYAVGSTVIQMLKVELLESILSDNESEISAKHTFEINGKRFTEVTSVGTHNRIDGDCQLHISSYNIVGCTKLVAVKDLLDQTPYVINANGIASVSKFKTAIVDNVVTHTYIIRFDNGSTTTFDVKDGVGISNVSVVGRGSYEDTYEIALTNGNTTKFKIPNTNAVGIIRRNRDYLINAENTIPLEHTVNTKVVRKNAIQYNLVGAGEYYQSVNAQSSVTCLNNGDGSIDIDCSSGAVDAIFEIARGVTMLEVGKTYRLSGSDKLTFEYLVKDPANNETLGTHIIHNGSTVTWYAGYVARGVYVNVSQSDEAIKETIYPMLCDVDYDNGIFTPPVQTQTVKLRRCGKNLIKYPHAMTTRTIDGVLYTDMKDGSVFVSGTATANSIYYICQTTMSCMHLAPGTYTLSGCPSGGSQSSYRITIKTDDSLPEYFHDIGDGCTFTLDKEKMVYIYICVSPGVSMSGAIFRPQLEVGNSASGFEEYVGEEYSLTHDGYPVTRVTSLSPMMNLLTDTKGVLIDATYNLDQSLIYDEFNADLDKFREDVDNVVYSMVDKTVGVNKIIRKSENLLNPDSPDVVKDRDLGSTTGTLFESASRCVSGKIPVLYGETYVVTKPVAQGVIGVVYDINDNFLGAVKLSDTSINTDDSCVFTIPYEKAAYIRLNSHLTESPTIYETMLLKGTEYPAEYVPFRQTLNEEFGLNDKQLDEVREIAGDSATVTDDIMRYVDGITTPLSQRIDALEQELNGVEEDLRMINEGGVE